MVDNPTMTTIVSIGLGVVVLGFAVCSFLFLFNRYFVPWFMRAFEGNERGGFITAIIVMVAGLIVIIFGAAML